MSCVYFNTDVVPEQAEGDPAGPDDVRLLQTTRGDSRHRGGHRGWAPGWASGVTPGVGT